MRKTKAMLEKEVEHLVDVNRRLSKENRRLRREQDQMKEFIKHSKRSLDWFIGATERLIATTKIQAQAILAAQER